MIRFYYNRDEQKRPIETVCLVARDGVLARGVARCNMEMDSISKKLGRGIAYGRAVKAIETGDHLVDGEFIRAYHNPELSDFERRLVGVYLPWETSPI